MITDPIEIPLIYRHTDSGLKYHTLTYVKIKTDTGWIDGISYCLANGGPTYVRSVESFKEKFERMR
jgi:hypothetical protein